jgi:hypothetical protein
VSLFKAQSLNEVMTESTFLVIAGLVPAIHAAANFEAHSQIAHAPQWITAKNAVMTKLNGIDQIHT